MSSGELSEAQIFDCARKIPSDEDRRDYLDQVCGDPALLERIERLLAEDKDDSFLETPASDRQSKPDA